MPGGKEMKKVTQLPSKIVLERKKKVAAYARVSSGKEAMLHSLSAQISYYSDLIQRNNEWIFAGVYTDEAITGTKEERPNFNKMIEDAKNGKINLIITKTISRFARNTVTLLRVVRELKQLNIDVYFEEQRIHSTNKDGELMLTILASYAQEESRSVSENMKWRIKNNFEEGIPWGFKELGYFFKEGKIIIVPEEANLVKKIYNLYQSGKGYHEISKIMKNEHSEVKHSWCYENIRNILSNTDYSGNLYLQKTFCEDYITKKSRINKGERNKYFIEGSHEPIIDIETFNKVQEEIKIRSKRANVKGNTNAVYPFTQMLVCEKCGSTYRRRTTPYKHVWQCSNFIINTKKACAAKQVPEDILYEVTNNVLNIQKFNEDVFKSQISKIIVCDNKILKYIFKDGKIVIKEWRDHPRSDSWTKEKRDLVAKKNYERKMNNGQSNNNTINN